MKITDIVTEEIDLEYWKAPDRLLNPEALEYVEKQERRAEIINKLSPGTKVFTKPVRNKQKKFSNQPKKGEPKSAGYAGNVDLRVRTGHLDQDEGNDLLD